MVSFYLLFLVLNTFNFLFFLISGRYAYYLKEKDCISPTILMQDLTKIVRDGRSLSHVSICIFFASSLFGIINLLILLCYEKSDCYLLRLLPSIIFLIFNAKSNLEHNENKMITCFSLVEAKHFLISNSVI